MAIVLKPKKSETALSVPTTSDLAVGEICINVADQKIYTRKSDDSIVVVASTTTGVGTNSIGITELNVSEGTNGQVLSTNGSGTLSFITVSGGGGTLTANSVNGTHIALGSDVAGDVMYYDGTDYIRLGKGSDGEVLTLTSGVPSWGAVSIEELDVTDGTENQVLVTDGSGSLSFATLETTTGITFSSLAISQDTTFNAGDDGNSIGPITINSGITVTVTVGSTWTISDN
jgi:hypothetical protein